MVQLGLLLRIKLSMKLLFVVLMRWDGSLRLDRSSKNFFSGAGRVYLTGPCKFVRFGIMFMVLLQKVPIIPSDGGISYIREV